MASPYAHDCLPQARVLLVRLGRTEAIPIRQLQHVFDKKNLVSAVRKRQEAAAERKAAIKAAKERGENHYAFEEEYDRCESCGL